VLDHRDFSMSLLQLFWVGQAADSGVRSVWYSSYRAWYLVFIWHVRYSQLLPRMLRTACVWLVSKK